MQTTLLRWLPSAALGAILGSASPAEADVPSSLSWTVPPSCPSEEAVLERLRRTGDERSLPSPIDANVSITRGDDDRWRGHLQLVTDHAWTEREIEAAPTCETVVDAIVVILSVAAAAHPAPKLQPQPPCVAPAPPPTGAYREDPDAFASGGRLVITANAQVSYDNDSSVGLRALFAPAVDVVLVPRLTLGAMFVYEHRKTLAPAQIGTIAVLSNTAAPIVGTAVEDTESLGGGLRIGYDLRGGDRWSLWPTLSVAFERTFVEGCCGQYDTVSGDAFVPVLLHVAPQVVFGVGPDLQILHEGGSVSSNDFALGFRLAVGGSTDLRHGPS